MMMIGKAIDNFMRKSFLDPNTAFLQRICFVGLTVILVGGITKHDHYNKLFFVFLGLSSYFYFQRNRLKARQTNAQ